MQEIPFKFDVMITVYKPDEGLAQYTLEKLLEYLDLEYEIKNVTRQ